MKRNEVWGKERWTPFFLYKWTKQSCSKLNRKQQIPLDHNEDAEELGCWITASISPTTGKSHPCPAKVSNGIQPFPYCCIPYFAGPNQPICGPVSRILRVEKGQKEDLFLAYFVKSLLYPCHILSATPKRLILLIPI